MADGRVTIKINWDNAQLRRDLTQIEREINSRIQNIDVGLNINTSEAISEAEQAQRNIERAISDVETDVNISVDESQLDELQDQIQDLDTNIDVGVEVDSDDIDSVQREIQALNGENIDVGIEVDESEIDTAQRQIQSLNGESVDVEVNVDTSQIEQLQTELNQLESGIDIGGVVAGVATGATIASGITSINDFEKALNTLQTQTGSTNQEMEDLDDTLLSIYKNNFGENFEDIAQTMATVKNQMKLTGDELNSASESALLLRDTFDIDVTEGIRGANALMSQFGISSQQAFELMSQGAQKGLNQNQDLSDQIAEYAVYFNDMGFSAEEMFNMLANGAETGVYQIDYLNDAMKEFGIRTKDNSDVTKTAFMDLGLNIEDMSNAFASGGEQSREAFDTVIDTLQAIEDPLKRNEIGVALFGTKFEDLGEDAIFALTLTQGEISATADKLQEINAIKYDSIGEAFTGLGRVISTDVFLPLGEQIVPTIEGMIDTINSNMPQIQEVILNVTDAIGKLFNFIIENIDTIGLLVTVIGSMVAAYKAWQIVTTLVTGAQNLLAVAMNATPIGLITTAIVGLVAGFIYLWNTSEEFRNFWINLWENIKEFTGAVVEGIGYFFTDYIPTRLNELNEEWQSIWNGIANFFQGIGEFIATVFYNIGAFFTTTLPNSMNSFKQFWINLWEEVKSNFSGFSDYIGEIIQKVIDTFLDFISDVKGIGGDIITGLWEGIKAKIDWLLGNVKGFVDDIKTLFTDGFDIHSPSKWSKYIMEMIMTGMDNSVQQDGQDVLNSTDSFANNLASSLSNWDYDIPSIPEIPYSAQGGILTTGAQQIINADLPESSRISSTSTSTIDDFVSQMLTKLGLTENGNSFNLNIDGKTFARVVMPYIIEEFNRLGYDLEGRVAVE